MTNKPFTFLLETASHTHNNTYFSRPTTHGLLRHLLHPIPNPQPNRNPPHRSSPLDPPHAHSAPHESRARPCNTQRPQQPHHLFRAANRLVEPLNKRNTRLCRIVPKVGHVRPGGVKQGRVGQRDGEKRRRGGVGRKKEERCRAHQGQEELHVRHFFFSALCLAFFFLVCYSEALYTSIAHGRTYRGCPAGLCGSRLVQTMRCRVGPFCGLFALLLVVLEACYVLTRKVESVCRQPRSK